MISSELYSLAHIFFFESHQEGYERERERERTQKQTYNTFEYNFLMSNLSTGDPAAAVRCSSSVSLPDDEPTSSSCSPSSAHNPHKHQQAQRLRANTLRAHVVPIFQLSPRTRQVPNTDTLFTPFPSSSSLTAASFSCAQRIPSSIREETQNRTTRSSSNSDSSDEDSVSEVEHQPQQEEGTDQSFELTTESKKCTPKKPKPQKGSLVDPLSDVLAPVPTTAPKDEEEYAARQKMIRLRAATVVTCLSPSFSKLRQGLLVHEKEAEEEEEAMRKRGGGPLPRRRPTVASGSSGQQPSGSNATLEHQQQQSVPQTRFHFEVNNVWMDRVRQWQAEVQRSLELGHHGRMGSSSDADVPFLPARLRRGGPPVPGVSATSSSGGTDAQRSDGTAKSVENWSVARRLGFPCSPNYVVADAEYEATALMDAAAFERDEQWSSAIRGVPLLASSTATGNANLRKLCRAVGIPTYLRGIMWLTLSGVANRIEENNGMSAALLRRHGPIGGEPQLTIEKDLLRTFPDHPYFAPEDIGMPKLERVLHALCWRNPLLNYCQSFNFIVAILLLVTDDEEATFWLMCYFLEEILPNDFYGEGLVGLKVDQEVIATLLPLHLPKLAAHFQDVGFDVRALVPGWLMSLFVNTFPIDTVLRIWDVLVTHPSGTLDAVLLPSSAHLESGSQNNNSSSGSTAPSASDSKTHFFGKQGGAPPPPASPSSALSSFPITIILAFLKLEQDLLLSLDDSSEILYTLTQRSAVLFDAEKLIKEALKFRVSPLELHSLRRQNRLQMYQREANRRVLRSGYCVQQFKVAEESQYVPDAVDVGPRYGGEDGQGAAGSGGMLLGGGGLGAGHGGGDETALQQLMMDEEMTEMTSQS